MIRKMIILTLTLIAVATGVLYAANTCVTCGYLYGSSVIVIMKGCLCIMPNDAGMQPGFWMADSIPGNDFRLLPFWGPAGISLIMIPLWIPVLLFGAYPALALTCDSLRRHQRRRHSSGLCTKCGYDLTGNVSGVCPECGTEAERP